MQNKHILVTGGAGYIGSHACKALARAGYTPVTYDNLVRGHEWAVQWGPLERGDINDKARLVEVLTTYAPMAVMHFAALAYVGESVQKPADYYRNNVAGTCTLLEAMLASRVLRLVFSSSCAVYGVPASLPIGETTALGPINPYGAGKMMAERMIADCAVHGISAVALRYFNAAGADVDAETGEVHSPETHVIPNLLRTAYGRQESFSIFGSDYPTPDHTCIRDYIHVTDLADAHLRALTFLDMHTGFSVCNLGTGTGISVGELCDYVQKITKKELVLTRAPRRPGDPAQLVAAATKAGTMLGWQPRHSDITTILQTAHAWYKKAAAHVA